MTTVDGNVPADSVSVVPAAQTIADMAQAVQDPAGIAGTAPVQDPAGIAGTAPIQNTNGVGATPAVQTNVGMGANLAVQSQLSNAKVESGTLAPVIEALRVHADDMRKLKERALARGLDVPDSVIRDLNDVDLQVQTTDPYSPATNLSALSALATRLDLISRALMQLPGMADRPPESTDYRRFKWFLLALAIVSTVVAAYIQIEHNAFLPGVAGSGIAAILGVLGAVVFVLYNLIGVVIDPQSVLLDAYSISVRVVLGALVGWVLVYAISPDTFGSANFQPTYLLLPFLAGFSTKLVVGILNKAIRTVETTLNLDDKAAAAK